MVIARRGQAAQGEVDDDVAGCGVGVDLRGQGERDVVRGGGVGGREVSQEVGCGVSGNGWQRPSAGARLGVWWSDRCGAAVRTRRRGRGALLR